MTFAVDWALKTNDLSVLCYMAACSIYRQKDKNVLPYSKLNGMVVSLV